MFKKLFALSFLLGSIFILLALAAWECWWCGRIPPGGSYRCAECCRSVAVVDAVLVENKSSSGLIGAIYGDHWHVYKCPYCKKTTTVYIGKLGELNKSSPNQPGASCFIATAAFGTSFSQEVEILREFRDSYLLTNPIGKLFINFYYKTSPPIANFIAKSEKGVHLQESCFIQ